MSLIINLTPGEEARLSAAATQTGLAPAEFAEKLLRENLPAVSVAEELRKKLHERQAQDCVTLLPSRPAAEIFAQWEREAAQMTDEERQGEDDFWEGFQQGANQTRAELGMRQL